MTTESSMQGRNPDFDSLLPAARLTRRGFVATALGVGFAMAAGPVAAQTAIKTDSTGLVAGEVKIGELAAYRAQPEGGKNLPTVLVVHEIFGVHEYIKDVCRRLAKLGYLAIAAEMYARYGDVSKMNNIREILDGPVAAASDSEHMSDLDACAAWAAKNGGDPARLGITGFCRGGRTTWLYAAHNPQLKAAVAWYGYLDGQPSALRPKSPLDLAAEITVPVLGLYGGKDPGIQSTQIDDMKMALELAGSKSRLHVYPEAGHAFHADYRPTYRKEAAEDGWNRLTAWFKQHGL